MNNSRVSDAFHVYDTTLRDGAQREGITYSVEDKLAVAKLLDDFGVGFIEGGWPGALPKDTEFFERISQGDLVLKNAKLVAFGATRKAGVAVEDDPQVRALIDSQAPVITLVAKSDVWHVEQALKTTLEENLAMISDTVSFLVDMGRRVFVDFEHFFDGYKHDPDFGVAAVQAAMSAGADVAVLCDTNGGMLPTGIFTIVSDVVNRTGARIGIHCQDDTGCAIANSVAAVEAGATHVQCTANGYGERTGNADLFSVVANLELKLGMHVLPVGAMKEMVRVSHAIAEIANLPPNTHQPYVGTSSFAHKAGLHASALKVNSELYNHIDAAVVGNDMRILVTEMAGRASIELKGKELGYDLSDNAVAVTKVVEQVKNLEAQGWSFEAADASFELLLQAAISGNPVNKFTVESWRTIVEQREDGTVVSEATVKLHTDGERIIATGEGNGPVNALDNALRSALMQRFPELSNLELVDYKVRILDGGQGTGAVTRVLIETTDRVRRWDTVGVHENVIAASWLALEDAIAYGLLNVKDR
ncbi:MAG: citramalate synthase [Actinomycetes bacterium]